MLNALLVLLMLTAEPQPCGVELFHIARSINANVVVYSANLKDGKLDPAEPVLAEWLMADGHREPLTWLEKSVYGFDTRPDTLGGYWLTFRTMPSKRVLARLRSGCPEAMMLIAGRSARLRRIFINVSDMHATLEGEDLTTGERVSEVVRRRS